MDFPPPPPPPQYKYPYVAPRVQRPIHNAAQPAFISPPATPHAYVSTPQAPSFAPYPLYYTPDAASVPTVQQSQQPQSDATVRMMHDIQLLQQAFPQHIDETHAQITSVRAEFDTMKQLIRDEVVQNAARMQEMTTMMYVLAKSNRHLEEKLRTVEAERIRMQALLMYMKDVSFAAYASECQYAESKHASVFSKIHIHNQATFASAVGSSFRAVCGDFLNKKTGEISSPMTRVIDATVKKIQADKQLASQVPIDLCDPFATMQAPAASHSTTYSLAPM
jgi:hypothetical protein